MSHQTVRYMNTGDELDERDDSDYGNIAFGTAINFSISYTLFIRFLMFT